MDTEGGGGRIEKTKKTMLTYFAEKGGRYFAIHPSPGDSLKQKKKPKENMKG